MGIEALKLQEQIAVLSGLGENRDHKRARIADLRSESVALAQKADGFTRAIVDSDDRKAAHKKLLVIDEKRAVDQSVSDLEAELVNLDRQIEDENRTLNLFQRYAMAESLSGGLQKEIPILGDRLSSIVAPVAELAGEFNAKFDMVINECLPLLAPDDPGRIRGLQDKLGSAVLTGIQGELASRFQAVGLHVLDFPGHLPTSFRQTVGDAVDALIGAIETSLPANAASGTSRYRCLTSISGLHGLFFREGEIVSLRPDDSRVVKLVELGSLEAVLVKGSAA